MGLVMELPIYTMQQGPTLRTVRAAKVESISSTGLTLEGGIEISVSLWWALRHQPKPGGFYILDGDDETYAPTRVFESGFKRAGGILE